MDDGKICFQKGEFEDALKLFDTTVDAQPTEGEPHYWRAKCLEALDRKKEAVAEYKIAMMLSSDAKIKEECKSALEKTKTPVPQGNVADKLSGKGKPFQLSAHQLNWNLKVDESLTKTLKSDQTQLDDLISKNQKLTAALNASFEPQARLLAAEDLKGPSHFTGQLSANEIATLKNCDIYIILDHSGSMGIPDCPSSASGVAQSRVDWVIEELTSFATSLKAALPHGFTFITYDTRPDLYQIHDVAQFNPILRSITSGGGTILTPALQEAYRIHAAHANQPMVIAIVSDCEIGGEDLRNGLSEGSRRYPSPGVFFTFAQIGILAEQRLDTDAHPHALSSILSRQIDNLSSVRLEKFSSVRSNGLGRTLLKALQK